MANISWENETATIDYNVGAINGVSHHIFNDYFYIYFRPEIVKSIKLKTPTLVKGFYNIWYCARTQTSSARQYRAYVYFNGEQTTRIIDGSKAYNSFGGNYITDGQLNMNGFKIYQYNPSDFVVTDPATIPDLIAKGRSENWLNSAAWSRYAGQLAGTVEVKETGPQTIEFVATAGGNGSYMYLDMIQFIPVDEDQNWPRINVKDGTFVYKEDLENGNFPNKNEKNECYGKNRLIILFLVSLLLGTCTDAWEEHTRINDNVSQETILDYLEAHSEFSQFTGLLKSVGMEGNFSYPGLFTLYAPTNSAMEKVSAGMIDSDEKETLCQEPLPQWRIFRQLRQGEDVFNHEERQGPGI